MGTICGGTESKAPMSKPRRANIFSNYDQLSAMEAAEQELKAMHMAEKDFFIMVNEDGAESYCGLEINSEKLIKKGECVALNSKWLHETITNKIGTGKCIWNIEMLNLTCESKEDCEQILLILKDRETDAGFEQLRFIAM